MMRPHPTQPGRIGPRTKLGVALIEAMVALVIMAFGMLALAGLQGNMRRGADLAKQRGEAIRLAQADMERLRSFSVLGPENPPAGVQSYAQIQSITLTDAGLADSNASFTLTRTVTEWPEPALQKAVRVEVSWDDRAGGPQSVIVDSFIARVDPSLSGSLGVAPESAPLRRPAGRNAGIPLGAKDLGNKTSVFVPGPTATVAWVFNNLTGAITGRCTVAMGTLSSALTASDVLDCSNNTFGYLLSGFVRFSFAASPSAEQPASPALAKFKLLIAEADALLPTSASAPAPPPVPAPAHQCFDNAPADASFLQPFVSYYCIVFPNTDSTPKWSGKLLIADIPLGSGERKICRYSADYDGDKKISNAEHPLNYRAVTGALTRQNFLVINASANCPAGQAADPSAGRFSNSATVQHQPQGIETPPGG